VCINSVCDCRVCVRCVYAVGVFVLASLCVYALSFSCRGGNKFSREKGVSRILESIFGTLSVTCLALYVQVHAVSHLLVVERHLHRHTRTSITLGLINVFNPSVFKLPVSSLLFSSLLISSLCCSGVRGQQQRGLHNETIFHQVQHTNFHEVQHTQYIHTYTHTHIHISHRTFCFDVFIAGA